MFRSFKTQSLPVTTTKVETKNKTNSNLQSIFFRNNKRSINNNPLKCSFSTTSSQFTSKTMKAIQLKEFGDPDVMYIDESVASPQISSPDDVIVSVSSSAVNRADTLQRRGKYPPPKGASDIMGLEIAGTVDHVGSHVEQWKPGDRVMALLAGGGYAQQACVSQNHLISIPSNISLLDAGAIPEVFLTAYQALFTIADLQSSQNVLIHAGASGVGTAAIQLAKMAGARHIVTTSSTAKIQACRDMGATCAVSYEETENWDQLTEEQTQGEGVHVCLDFVGQKYLSRNLKSLARDGHLVILATLSGAIADKFDMRPAFKKALNLHFSTLRSRSTLYKTQLTNGFKSFAMPGFERGELKPVIDSVYDIKDVAEAHRRIEANKNIGKVVLDLSKW
eukprot:gb/GECH01000037.1/.p1 GENE.gb/GECH01000037.1/~~gb/GECH01000037.1/.p1  ORF type:complete len:392 (+),score=94.40 gb/GECH01000037.1/:1-1176(+)